jgi:hypothetical protein
MSITIYEGLRATETDPFKVGLQVRAVLEPLFFNKVSQLEEKLKAHEDESLKRTLMLPDKLEKGYTEAHSVFAAVAMLQAHSMRSFSPASIGYGVTLISSANDERVLALVFSEDHAYQKALIEAGVFEDFGYWSSSDPDEDVSDEDWEYRKASWSYLTEGNASPSSVGLEITYPSIIDYQVWKWAQAEKARS